jgi:hypothetical protein
MRQALQYGLITGLRYWKTALLVWFLQTIIALTLGLQVWHILEASIGHSLQLEKLLNSYDHTVFMDFLNVHGASVSPLIGQLRWVLAVYALCCVFINGGMIYMIVKGENSLKAFWTGGSSHFFPFLKIAFFYLVLFLLWSGALWLPFFSQITQGLKTLPSEKTLLQLLLAVFLVWAVGIIFLFNASILSRTARLSGKERVWPSIRSGLLSAWQRWLKTTFVFLFFTAVQLVLITTYWWLETTSGMISPLLILVFFVLQQVFVFLRIVGRVMLMGGVSRMLQVRL